MSPARVPAPFRWVAVSALSRPPRARAAYSHRLCPGRAYYRTRDQADEARQWMGGVPTACSRCGGFHLPIPRPGR
ncbi:hypothetical protein Ae505Ps2_2237 [Pseudonocardia sp. Ae505_Ps2]|nr:hypothetical protein Ae505Ps2_2237 [Pseudonocardia sp. Ae505_Ps2]